MQIQVELAKVFRFVQAFARIQIRIRDFLTYSTIGSALHSIALAKLQKLENFAIVLEDIN